MRFSIALLSSVFLLNTIVCGTPLPAGNSSTTVCDQQETQCLAGTLSKENCDKLYQECRAAAGSSLKTVLSTFSAASPTLEPEASSTSVALVEPTTAIITTPASRKNTRAAQPGGHKGGSKNKSNNESTVVPNDNSRGNALANEVLIAVSD
ncbi:hypothetical protein SISSUDRAFT_1066487 [Sistotremastrum suecicum HHB10207 ss-3]|uniref:Uncharacterized protein n=1 Tax=Sistotremastrum suecicum HHB10207 ss-3 TaxID=1314776 RepID=A0A165Y992_9AGAM|nr:hypothetical protein SISSUDRAFT_1066487 [Sistotremastrum suecicum HHB10207 ss-3]